MNSWRRFKTKVFVAVLIILIMAGTALAAGQRREVRVPGLRRALGSQATIKCS
jgi:hypothetical protein